MNGEQCSEVTASSRGALRKLQVGADRKRQQASPPRVKDWLKREEILSLYRNRQPGSSKNTAAKQFGWCFCLLGDRCQQSISETHISMLK